MSTLLRSDTAGNLLRSAGGNLVRARTTPCPDPCPGPFPSYLRLILPSPWTITATQTGTVYRDFGDEEDEVAEETWEVEWTFTLPVGEYKFVGEESGSTNIARYILVCTCDVPSSLEYTTTHTYLVDRGSNPAGTVREWTFAGTQIQNGSFGEKRLFIYVDYSLDPMEYPSSFSRPAFEMRHTGTGAFTNSNTGENVPLTGAGTFIYSGVFRTRQDEEVLGSFSEGSLGSIYIFDPASTMTFASNRPFYFSTQGQAALSASRTFVYQQSLSWDNGEGTIVIGDKDDCSICP